MSLSASCTLAGEFVSKVNCSIELQGYPLNAMETPLARTTSGGAVAQKMTFCPYRSNRLYPGARMNKTGQANAHSQSTRPVPRRLCSIGNTISSQAA